MKKTGRRRVEINLEELEKLSALQATDEEIAYFFGTDRRTILRRKKEASFREVMERGKAKGRISIRRMLFQIAQSGKAGSVAASIFLAKNILGYSDVPQAAPETPRVAPLDRHEAMNQIRAIYGLEPTPRLLSPATLCVTSDVNES